MMSRFRRSGRAWGAVAAAALLAGLGGCKLNKQQIPDLSGPSELAMSLQLTASPDVIVADGISTSAIRVVVRNQNGQPLAGQGIFFSIAVGGSFADVGTLSETTATSNSSGIAQVIYRSPARTDNTARRLVEVAARPVTGDARGQIYRTVTIELRSAEPRLFPPNPFNCVGVPPPNPGTSGCPFASFVVEGPFGRQFLFQSTSTDSPDSTGRIGIIVRYEWDFGDGSQGEDRPDVSHTYHVPGTYAVTHRVTDDNGATATAVRTVVVP